jgi:hypothetical protein
MVCAAEANDVVTNRPAFTGVVRPPEAVACIRELIDRDRVYVLPNGDIGEACGGDRAVGCTAHDFEGCGDDQVFIPSGLIPPDLITVGDSHGLYTPSSVALGAVLYHEAVHAVQGPGDCGNSREIEAYDQQVRFDFWLSGQLSSFLPVGLAPPCPVSLDDALGDGLDPCVFDFIRDAFPDVDTANPLPAGPCQDIIDLRTEVNRNFADANESLAAQEEAGAHCEALVAASSSIRFASDQWPFFVAVAAGDNIVFQFQAGPDGAPEEIATYNPGFDEVRDLRIIHDASGADVLLIAGIDDGMGAIAASRDVAVGEFGAVPDGLFDENIAVLTNDSLQEASELVQAGSSPLLVFDRAGQAAYQILLDEVGEPSELLEDPAILVPVGTEAASLVHEPDRPSAYAKLAFADSGDSTTLLQFDDADGDGFYDLVGEGTAQELGRLPPALLTTPMDGASEAWVSGGIGHTIEIFPTDSDGVRTGLSIGAGAVPANGQLLLSTVPRTFVLDEFLRLKDVTSGVMGAFTRVLPGRMQAHYYAPHSGPADGGTAIFFRGQGFTHIIDVKFDGARVPFEIVSDSRMVVTSPPGLGIARITADGLLGRTTIGSFRYVKSGGGYQSDTAEDFAAWSPDGQSGWSCGSSVIPADGTPVSGDRAGCRYEGAAGRWGSLESPLIELSNAAPLRLFIEHRSDFGDDGDGAVIQAGDGALWRTLTPIGRRARRLDGAACHGGDPGARVCTSDPPVNGQRGYSRAAANRTWHVDELALPEDLETASSLRIRVVATNMNDAAAAVYELSSILLVPVDDRPRPSFSRWTTDASFESSCDAVETRSPFECAATSPLAGASGSVLRYSGASAQGEGTASLPFVALPERRTSVLLRHAVDFTGGRPVGSGLGRVEVCCSGSCAPIEPVDGYPPTAAGSGRGFGDEGPEGVWMVDELDLTAFAGLESCSLRLVAGGAARPAQTGWVVDSIVIRSR